jgi:hypothetical protein
MGPWDPRVVKRDHTDHTDVKNFTSFHDSHIEFLAKVQCGDLSPPSVLVQTVGALAKDLNKKFTKHLGSV